jgi:peptidyl-prolyl cis-trans isomerase SurA
MVLKTFLVACLAAFAATVLADAAAAQQPPRGADRRIAAIVNRDAITLDDLDQRVRFMGLGARLPEGGEARTRLLNEVLRSMINERLQLQESKRQGVEVTDKEVQDQVAEIERRNRMQRGGLAAMLKQRNIEPRTFEDQVRASLAWQKVIQVKIQPQIRVSDLEVATVLKRLKENKDKLQYRLQEIFLPVDNPQQQARALQTAQFILGQLRGGASFEILARQFSQTGTASSGGDMGFLFEGQMEADIERAVKQLKTGQVAGPLRGAGGYYIIRLSDRRTIGGRNPDVKAVAVAQATIRLPEKATPAQVKQAQERLVKIGAEAKDCAGLVKAINEGGGVGRIADEIVPEQQRPEIRALILPLKVGQVSRTLTEFNTVSLYKRCEDTGAKDPEEKDVREALLRQRVGAFAERFLKELRRSAYVDIRV